MQVEDIPRLHDISLADLAPKYLDKLETLRNEVLRYYAVDLRVRIVLAHIFRPGSTARMRKQEAIETQTCNKPAWRHAAVSMSLIGF